MGVAYSSKKKKLHEIKKQKKKNEKIDEQLITKTYSKVNKKELSLLLLGTGESGKSTFLKQMRIINKGGFSNSDYETYRKTIRTNLVLHMKLLFEFSLRMGYEVKPKNQELGNDFLKMLNISQEFSFDKVEYIKCLWQDNGLKMAFENRSQFQIPDTANYFFDKIEEIVDKDYQPTDKDILFCRIPTTGVNQLIFEQDNTIWKIIDVGGQRSERRKWIHQFENVDLLIYIVALSEYDQKLFENFNINRLAESLELFTKISNNNYFENKNCIIFFNKTDLFEEKIKKVSLKQCFPEYNGGLDFEAGKQFIRQKFVDKAENNQRNIFSHFTCATNTKNIERVIDTINITVIEHILKEDGYL
ncbi:g protein alpha i subunit [Anaeramoeba flamelloides]|uniref:G protein alpha i subunit n=1 Tax=Anaeramoeba flamelloides TaxID=1746091 RepID=A0ABQ8Z5Q6_9EUKA|nr:g protein alpha i subunit [Anaeramoeba flamelloides]